MNFFQELCVIAVTLTLGWIGHDLWLFRRLGRKPADPEGDVARAEGEGASRFARAFAWLVIWIFGTAGNIQRRLGLLRFRVDCSWCNQYIRGPRKGTKISHGICPACAAVMRSKASASFQSRQTVNPNPR